MFRQIREEKGISQSEVARGLLAQRTLSGFERQGEIPGFLLLNAIVQRIGCSMEYFLTTLSKDEYEYLTWRKEIIQKIEENQIEDADWNSPMAGNRKLHVKLQEQFITFWKGYQKDDIEIMRRAVSLTVEWYPQKIEIHRCISAEEINFILLCMKKNLGKLLKNGAKNWI